MMSTDEMIYHSPQHPTSRNKEEYTQEQLTLSYYTLKVQLQIPQKHNLQTIHYERMDYIKFVYQL